MIAAIVEGPGKLAVRDVPEPQLTNDYEALCELLYGATCTGTDSHIIQGTFPFSSPLPTVLGHESIGRVVKLGPKVRNFRVGDLVTRVGMPAMPAQGLSVTWGGFAELGLARDHWAMAADGLPPEQWSACRVNQVLPAAVAPPAAPMFTTWRETLSFLSRMMPDPGLSVLVAGSGGNGLSFAVHAANLGAARVAMVGAATARNTAAKAGITAFFDYRVPDWPEQVAKAVPEGFDLIVDAVGKQGLADQLLPLLKPGGRLALYGIDDFGKITLNPGRSRGTFTVWNGGYDEAETHQRVSDFHLQGKLDARLWLNVDSPFPLTEIQDAFAAVHERRFLKALVQLSSR